MPLSGTKEFLEFLSDKPSLPIGEQLKELRGKDVTEDYFIKNGFTKPIIIHKKKGLRIVVPEMPFSIEDVGRNLGDEYVLDVIDVLKQDQFKMRFEDFLNYFREKEPRSKRLNVLSLEISHTNIAHLVEPPYVIKEMSIVEKLWPCDDVYQATNKPSVQKYCLMSMKDSWTDFHIDFGGSSVWYHVFSGHKIFYLVPPRKRYIKAYTNWMGEHNNRLLYFPDQIKKFSACHAAEVYKLEIRTGDTILLPAGWIHAVHTLEDSLVFGGNFLHSLSIPLQLKIYKIERLLQTEDRFLFPCFEKLHWLAAEYILHKLERNLAHNIPPVKLILKGALKLIDTLPDWLSRYHVSTREEKDYNYPDKRALSSSKAQLIRQLNDVVQALIDGAASGASSRTTSYSATTSSSATWLSRPALASPPSTASVSHHPHTSTAIATTSVFNNIPSSTLMSMKFTKRKSSSSGGGGLGVGDTEPPTEPSREKQMKL